MAGTTLPGVLLTGVHGSRPAANAVGTGTLYSCTTHSLVYQTDGSSWTTWATLGAAASGSITSSGYTQNTARLLGRTTGSSGAIEEITVGSGLSLSAGALTASGGSGFTHSYIGYNTIGGSNENTSSRIIMKKVTISAACVIASIGAYIKQVTASQSIEIGVALLDDVAGTPTHLIGFSSPAATNLFLSTSNGAAGDARWVHMPLGLYVTAADYWLAVYLGGSNLYNVYYDGSGSDRTYTPGATRMSDAGWTTVTTTSNKYSIRASTIA